MKKDLLNIVKKGKPFKKTDLIIYLFIAVLIIGLFIGFYLFNNSSSSNGFSVYKNGNLILSCEYGSSLSVEENYENLVEINENVITIFASAEKTRYNVLEVNHTEKSVDIIFSNCSSSHDCTSLPKISGGKGTLVCVPHSLIIKSFSGEYIPPIAG